MCIYIWYYTCMCIYIYIILYTYIIDVWASFECSLPSTAASKSTCAVDGSPQISRFFPGRGGRFGPSPQRTLATFGNTNGFTDQEMGMADLWTHSFDHFLFNHPNIFCWFIRWMEQRWMEMRNQDFLWFSEFPIIRIITVIRDLVVHNFQIGQVCVDFSGFPLLQGPWLPTSRPCWVTWIWDGLGLSGAVWGCLKLSGWKCWNHSQSGALPSVCWLTNFFLVPWWFVTSSCW